jgi:hypothetical protein
MTKEARVKEGEKEVKMNRKCESEIEMRQGGMKKELGIEGREFLMVCQQGASEEEE